VHNGLAGRLHTGRIPLLRDHSDRRRGKVLLQDAKNTPVVI